MANFTSFSALRTACLDLPGGHPAASAAVAQREASLTKPPKSLGRLEDLVAWLAHWQGHVPPRLERVDILVFAGSHGVTKRGVSAYPAEVTAQMVANFASGGAAINQLARTAGARLRVIPLELDRPTADFTERPALGEQEFLAAVTAGYEAVSPQCDLICLGEMGIGNTTAAAAIAAALFGGGGARWAGRGTGVDEEGLARKRAVIDRALERHAAAARRSAGDCRGARRPRTCRHPWRHIGGAAAAHSSVARRFCLHCCRCTVGEAANRHAGARASRPRLGRSRTPHAA